LPPERQRSILAERLLAQVRYFGARADALPEWRDAAKISGSDELWANWEDLPVISKQTLRNRFNPTEMRDRLGIIGETKSTGGSTGEPTAFVHDLPAILAHNAAATYAQTRMGWQPGMPIIKVWGSDRDIGRAMAWRIRMNNALLRTVLVDGYRLDDDTLQRFLTALRRNRPAAVSGFTSMLAFIAQEVVDRGINVAAGSVSTAWNGGEMLLPEHSTLFQRAFGVPIQNLYGGRELSVIAFQPTHENTLEIVRPWLYAEIVGDDGRAVPAGEVGRILLTSTICRGTPFLRYEIGDLASAPADDNTEAGPTRLGALHGRTAGLLKLPNGRTISNLFWNHLFKEVPGVDQFQVVIESESSLRFLLVGRAFTSVQEQEFRQTVERLVGSLTVTVEWVPQIPLTPQGKLVQVVRRKAPPQVTPEVRR
jgi:phenylacetate-CoA ligase